jgi:mannose-6-phosphate isomerase
MDVLEPVVRAYDWGSHDVIARIRGRAVPSPGPEAELWFGAHPAAPSSLLRDGRPATLDAVVAADPEAALGPVVAARFGRLPFLLKILAAEKALSIQVHPSREQAELAFNGQPALGEPLYIDDWPKPEIICAITPIRAFAGFREPADAAALLARLEVARLAPLAGALAAEPTPERLLATMRELLTWPAEDTASLLAEVVAACAGIAAVPGPDADACEAVVLVAGDHPGDLGAVAALLLRHERIEPGEAMFMPAGGIHCYIRGAGIELLANSDNVLRAGLTPKPVNVAELLRIVDPAVRVPVLRPRELSPGVWVYDTPAPEFRLHELRLADAPLTAPGVGPRILLCLTGEAKVTDASGAVIELAGGQGCFVPAAAGAVTVDGAGRVFVAAPGL